jgi:hypothetical protein
MTWRISERPPMYSSVWCHTNHEHVVPIVCASERLLSAHLEGRHLSDVGVCRYAEAHATDAGKELQVPDLRSRRGDVGSHRTQSRSSSSSSSRVCVI